MHNVIRLLGGCCLSISLALTFHALAQENTPEGTPLGGGSGEILFVSDHGNGNQIYIMDVNGENVRQLTQGQLRPGGPRWSPDGMQIAFDGMGLNGREIFIMNADGSERHAITDNNVLDSGPVWSPDGTRIVFSSTRAGGEHLFMMDAEDGSSVQQLTFEAGSHYPDDWSPDGTWIASTRIAGTDPQGEVYLINVETQNSVRFTEWESNDLGGRWSPDGSGFMWVSNRAGFDELFMVDFEASLMELPLQESPDVIEQLTFARDGLQGHSFFSWSPDGQYVALAALRNNESPFDNVLADIYIVEVATGIHTQLTFDGSSNFPQWRP